MTDTAVSTALNEGRTSLSGTLIEMPLPPSVFNYINSTEDLNLSAGSSTVLEDIYKSGVVRVYCVTWNMYGKKAPEDLSSLIIPGSAHIFAIGTEECERPIASSIFFADKEKWESRLLKELGLSYTCVGSHTLAAVHLVVYAHDAIMSIISDIQTASVATGIANTLGNKGGVGIGFNVGKTSMLFVNCHLAAHQNDVNRRNEDYDRIDTRLGLVPSGFSIESTSTDADGSFGTSVSSSQSRPSRDVGRSGSRGRSRSRSLSRSISRSGVLRKRGSSSLAGSGESFSGQSNDRNQNSGRDASDSPGPNSNPPVSLSSPQLASSLSVSTAKTIGGSRHSASSSHYDGSALEVNEVEKVDSSDSVNVNTSNDVLRSSDCYDRVFWMGDLNYRVNMSREEANRAIMKGKFLDMLPFDQLTIERHAGNCFMGFNEAPITFAPTYKLDDGTNLYDTSAKQRVPSWTDRILFKSSLQFHLGGSSHTCQCDTWNSPISGALSPSEFDSTASRKDRLSLGLSHFNASSSSASMSPSVPASERYISSDAATVASSSVGKDTILSSPTSTMTTGPVRTSDVSALGGQQIFLGDPLKIDLGSPPSATSVSGNSLALSHTNAPSVGSVSSQIMDHSTSSCSCPCHTSPIVNLYYSSLADLMISDHKPVAAFFDVHLRRGLVVSNRSKGHSRSHSVGAAVASNSSSNATAYGSGNSQSQPFPPFSSQSYFAAAGSSSSSQMHPHIPSHPRKPVDASAGSHSADLASGQSLALTAVNGFTGLSGTDSSRNLQGLDPYLRAAATTDDALFVSAPNTASENRLEPSRDTQSRSDNSSADKFSDNSLAYSPASGAAASHVSVQTSLTQTTQTTNMTAKTDSSTVSFSSIIKSMNIPIVNVSGSHTPDSSQMSSSFATGVTNESYDATVVSGSTNSIGIHDTGHSGGRNPLGRTRDPSFSGFSGISSADSSGTFATSVNSRSNLLSTDSGYSLNRGLAELGVKGVTVIESTRHYASPLGHHPEDSEGTLSTNSLSLSNNTNILTTSVNNTSNSNSNSTSSGLSGTVKIVDSRLTTFPTSPSHASHSETHSNSTISARSGLSHTPAHMMRNSHAKSTASIGSLGSSILSNSNSNISGISQSSLNMNMSMSMSTITTIAEHEPLDINREELRSGGTSTTRKKEKSQFDVIKELKLDEEGVVEVELDTSKNSPLSTSSTASTASALREGFYPSVSSPQLYAYPQNPSQQHGLSSQNQQKKKKLRGSGASKSHNNGNAAVQPSVLAAQLAKKLLEFDTSLSSSQASEQEFDHDKFRYGSRDGDGEEEDDGEGVRPNSYLSQASTGGSFTSSVPGVAELMLSVAMDRQQSNGNVFARAGSDRLATESTVMQDMSEGPLIEQAEASLLDNGFSNSAGMGLPRSASSKTVTNAVQVVERISSPGARARSVRADHGFAQIARVSDIDYDSTSQLSSSASKHSNIASSAATSTATLLDLTSSQGNLRAIEHRSAGTAPLTSQGGLSAASGAKLDPADVEHVFSDARGHAREGFNENDKDTAEQPALVLASKRSLHSHSGQFRYSSGSQLGSSGVHPSGGASNSPSKSVSSKSPMKASTSSKSPSKSSVSSVSNSQWESNSSSGFSPAEGRPDPGASTAVILGRTPAVADARRMANLLGAPSAITYVSAISDLDEGAVSPLSDSRKQSPSSSLLPFPSMGEVPASLPGESKVEENRGRLESECKGDDDSSAASSPVSLSSFAIESSPPNATSRTDAMKLELTAQLRQLALLTQDGASSSSTTPYGTTADLLSVNPNFSECPTPVSMSVLQRNPNAHDEVNSSSSSTVSNFYISSRSPIVGGAGLPPISSARGHNSRSQPACTTNNSSSSSIHVEDDLSLVTPTVTSPLTPSMDTPAGTSAPRADPNATADSATALYSKEHRQDVLEQVERVVSEGTSSSNSTNSSSNRSLVAPVRAVSAESGRISLSDSNVHPKVHLVSSVNGFFEKIQIEIPIPSPPLHASMSSLSSSNVTTPSQVPTPAASAPSTLILSPMSGLSSSQEPERIQVMFGMGGTYLTSSTNSSVPRTPVGPPAVSSLQASPSLANSAVTVTEGEGSTRTSASLVPDTPPTESSPGSQVSQRASGIHLGNSTAKDSDRRKLAAKSRNGFPIGPAPSLSQEPSSLSPLDTSPTQHGMGPHKSPSKRSFKKNTVVPISADGNVVAPSKKSACVIS